MSDTPASHHHHKKVHVLGVSRKKKYLKVFGILLLAALAAIAYFTITSGILAEENPAIPLHLVDRINAERAAHGLPPVKVSETLAGDAMIASGNVRVSQTSYVTWSVPVDPGTDVFVYPKLSWALSGARLEPMLFDSWMAGDTGFGSHVLDKDAREVGIGMSGDGYNYYIATKWQ